MESSGELYQAKALFTDEDLFTVSIASQPPKRGPMLDGGCQTDEILARDAETQSSYKSDAGVQTLKAGSRRAGSASSGTSTRANGQDGSGEDGKDGGGGKEGDYEDDDFDRRYGSPMKAGAELEDEKPALPPVPDSLAPMLKRTVPIMEAALVENLDSTALDAWQRLKDSTAGMGGAGGAAWQCALTCSLSPPPFAAAARLQCTGVAWNASGALVVAVFGRFDLNGWCSTPGMLCAWPVFRRDYSQKASAASSGSSKSSKSKEGEAAGAGAGGQQAPPEVSLEHSSCLMCVACHPTTPSLVAAGSFNGEVILYDLSLATATGAQQQEAAARAEVEAGRKKDALRKKKKKKQRDGGRGDEGDELDALEEEEGGGGGALGLDPCLYTSRIDDYFHREPISSLKWVYDNEEGDFALVSISADGKVLFWRLKHGLKYPIRGTRLVLRQAVTADGGVKGRDLAGLRLPAGGAVHGGTTVAFSSASNNSDASSSAPPPPPSSSSSSSGEEKSSAASSPAPSPPSQSSMSSKSGSNSKASFGAMQTSMMVVGSEAGAVIAWPPPTYSRFKEAGSVSWAPDGRKVLGFVEGAGNQESVANHVEKWAKANSHTFAAGRAIDALAVFQSKPSPDALFNANPDGGGGGGMHVTRYEAHAGPVLALEASPFHRHLFLSAGADGMLKLSSLLQHRPLLCLDPAGIVGGGGGGGGGSGSESAFSSLSGGGGASLYDAQWSRTRPLVFAAAASTGNVYLYDLSVSLSVPVTEFRAPAVQIPVTARSSRGSSGGGGGGDYDDDDDDDFQESKSGRGKGSSAAGRGGGSGQTLLSSGGAAVHSVSFNPKMRAFLAFGDAAGGVHVLKMPEALANVKSGEEQDLTRIAGTLTEDGADD